MPTSRSALVLCLAALSPAAAAAGPTTYAHDDGVGGSNIGPAGFDATVTWGNYFYIDPGANPLADRLCSIDPPGGENSWLFYDGMPTLDPGIAPFALRMADGPFKDDWMLRATAVPAPAGVFGLMGAGMLGLRRRR